MREYNFDGIVGPTHNYAGLSSGNVASMSHGGQISNPRRAALQGLAKVRLVGSLGVGQAVLPPHERPRMSTLRELGFRGNDEQVLARAASDPLTGDHALRLCSSAAAMWTANAATCIPSSDSADGRVHLVPANLTSMFHRVLEADTTVRVLRSIFAAEERFAVHDPLPGGAHFSDEGAANHIRLFSPGVPAVHLLPTAPRRRAANRCGFRPARRAKPRRRWRASARSIPHARCFRSSIRWGSTRAPSTPTSSRWATAASSSCTS